MKNTTTRNCFVVGRHKETRASTAPPGRDEGGTNLSEADVFYHPATGQTYATLPQVLLCSYNRLAGAGDGVSLLSGSSKNLRPASRATRQPRPADRSRPNLIFSHQIVFLPQPGAVCHGWLPCPPKLAAEASDDILLQAAKEPVLLDCRGGMTSCRFENQRKIMAASASSDFPTNYPNRRARFDEA